LLPVAPVGGERKMGRPAPFFFVSLRLARDQKKSYPNILMA